MTNLLIPIIIFYNFYILINNGYYSTQIYEKFISSLLCWCNVWAKLKIN